MKPNLENFCEICAQVTRWNLRDLTIKGRKLQAYQCSKCRVYANEDTLANMQRMYNQSLMEEK